MGRLSLKIPPKIAVNCYQTIRPINLIKFSTENGMKIILTLVPILFSLAMNVEAPPKYRDALLKSDPYLSMILDNDQIISIKQTEQIIRCPGCYEFEVLYKKDSKNTTDIAKFYTKDNAFIGTPILVFRRDEIERGPHS